MSPYERDLTYHRAIQGNIEGGPANPAPNHRRRQSNRSKLGSNPFRQPNEKDSSMLLGD